jgi:hypothetical protein
MGLGWGSSHDAFGYSNPDYPEPTRSHDEEYDPERNQFGEMEEDADGAEQGTV